MASPLLQLFHQNAHATIAARPQPAREYLAADVAEAPARIGRPRPFGMLHDVEPDIVAAFAAGLAFGDVEQLAADAAASGARQQVDAGNLCALRAAVDRFERANHHGEESDAYAFLPGDPGTRVIPGHEGAHRVGPKAQNLASKADRIVPVFMVGGRIGSRTDDAELGNVALARAGDGQVHGSTF